jgi:hypothetical protein
MLGNGLGAVVAFGGSIAVESRSHRLELSVDRLTGKTIAKDEPVEKRPGTRIILVLPGSDEGDAWLAQQSIRIAACGSPRYKGASNPHWYGGIGRYSDWARSHGNSHSTPGSPSAV